MRKLSAGTSVRAILGAVVVAALIAQACSLFVPFDDYAGTVDAAGTRSDGGQEGSNEAGAPVPPIADAASCTGDFTTNESCGACGRACSCDAGFCPLEVLLVDGGTNVTGLDLGGRDADGGTEALYFVRQSGLLARVDRDGGRYEEALVTATTAPISVGTTFGLVATKDGGVERFSRDRFADAGALMLVTAPDLGPLLYEPPNMFWTDGASSFWAAVKTTTNPASLGLTKAVAITSRDGVSFWVDADGLVQRMSTVTPGELGRVIATGQSGITGIALDATHLYLTQTSQGLLVYDYDGTTATLARLVPVPDPELVVADDEHVYVYDASPASGRRRVIRYASGGTDPLLLTGSLGAARALALDARWLYVADQSRIVRIVK